MDLTTTSTISSMDAKQSKYFIYPQPARDVLFLESNVDVPEDLDITCYNLGGSAIIMDHINQVSSASPVRLGLSGLAPGIYIMMVKSHTTRCTFKIIVF
jgi:hypothetical protein